MTRIVIRPEAEPTHVSDNRKILYVDQDDDHLKLIDASLTPTDLETGGGGGGGSSSSPRVYAIPFAFDTPDLLTGHVVYTPTVGDLILGFATNVTTLFDGLPRIQTVSITGSPDGGTFALNNGGFPVPFDVDAAGLLANLLGQELSVTSVTGTNPDFTVTIDNPYQEVFLADNSLTGGTSPDIAISTTQLPGTPSFDFGQFVGTFAGLYNDTGVNTGGFQLATSNNLVNAGTTFFQPGIGEYGGFINFDTADPLKIVVTNDGSSIGDDPGSTQGEATLYLVIATPETP